MLCIWRRPAAVAAGCDRAASGRIAVSNILHPVRELELDLARLEPNVCIGRSSGRDLDALEPDNEVIELLLVRRIFVFRMPVKVILPKEDWLVAARNLCNYVVHFGHKNVLDKNVVVKEVDRHRR